MKTKKHLYNVFENSHPKMDVICERTKFLIYVETLNILYTYP